MNLEITSGTDVVISTGVSFTGITNGAIGIQDGRIVRVGKRTELAGRLQERYGYAKDEAEKNIDTWLKSTNN